MNTSEYVFPAQACWQCNTSFPWPLFQWPTRASPFDYGAAISCVFLQKCYQTTFGTFCHFGTFYNFLAFSFFSTSLLTVQYFLPMAIISVAYSRIAFRLWGSKTPGAAQDERDHIILANKKKVSYMYLQGCRIRGVQGVAIAPPVFGRSNNPIRTRGGRFCPPYYYWPLPQIFGWCGVSDLSYDNLTKFWSCFAPNVDRKNMWKRMDLLATHIY